MCFDATSPFSLMSLLLARRLQLSSKLWMTWKRCTSCNSNHKQRSLTFYNMLSKVVLDVAEQSWIADSKNTVNMQTNCRICKELAILDQEASHISQRRSLSEGPIWWGKGNKRRYCFWNTIYHIAHFHITELSELYWAEVMCPDMLHMAPRVIYN